MNKNKMLYVRWEWKKSGWKFTWGSKRVEFIRFSYRSFLLFSERPFCYTAGIHFAAFLLTHFSLFSFFLPSKSKSNVRFFHILIYSNIKLIFHPIVHSTLVPSDGICVRFLFFSFFGTISISDYQLNSLKWKDGGWFKFIVYNNFIAFRMGYFHGWL